MATADRGSDFVRLLMQHERRIYAFIRSLVPNRADAEDVLQETSTVLWKKFDSFEPGSDFVAWALQIARYEISNYRRKHPREQAFSEGLLEMLSDQSQARQEQLGGAQAALAQCLERLRPQDRELLRQRYEPGVSVQSLATARNQPIQTIYSLLKRARRQLFQCIHRTLAAEDRA